jgi:hypothetical protein
MSRSHPSTQLNSLPLLLSPRSVKTQVARTPTESSSNQTARKRVTTSTPSTDPQRRSASPKSISRLLVRSPLNTMEPSRENSSTTISSAHASPVGENLAYSTEILGFGFVLHHLPTELQKLSADELMFVSHIYNWGLNRASQLAAIFGYKLQRPLRELLAMTSELDKTYNARSARCKRS